MKTIQHRPAVSWPMLDVLRVITSLLVLFGHTRNWFFTSITQVVDPSPALKLFWLVTVLEHEAVSVFFVLSGFLVGGSVCTALRERRFDVTKYLTARFVRIFIVYAPAVALSYALFWLGGHYLTDPGAGGYAIRPLFSEQQPDFGGVRSVLCHVAGIQGFGCQTWRPNPALWSLGYEWALYLFAPAALALLVLPVNALLRTVGLVLLVATAGTLAHDPLDCLFWFCAWFSGVAAWWLLDQREVPVVAGLAGVAGIAAAMLFSRLKIYPVVYTDTVIVLSASLAVSSRRLISYPLAARFFTWAASFSYSLYATHCPIIAVMIAVMQSMGFPDHKIPPQPLAFFAFFAVVVVSLIVAYVFALVTERQTDKVRSYLSRPSARQSRPSIAPAASRAAL